jgi:3-methyladenine DNA glycosylase AlkD
MPDLASVMAELQAKASAKTRAIYLRHGAPPTRTLGVSNADMKLIAKSIKRQQALAAELYETGIFDAMYLAGMVLDGKLLSSAQLQAWAEAAAGMPMVFEYTIPWLAVENPAAGVLANTWIESPKEHLGAAGWCTWSGIVTTTADDRLDLAVVRSLLEGIPGRIGGAANRVRATMNSFVIACGTYVAPLLPVAEATAQKLGVVAVDVGDTACEIPLATERIGSAQASGRAGTKRKTIRC